MCKRLQGSEFCRVFFVTSRKTLLTICDVRKVNFPWKSFHFLGKTVKVKNLSIFSTAAGIFSRIFKCLDYHEGLHYDYRINNHSIYLANVIQIGKTAPAITKIYFCYLNIEYFKNLHSYTHWQWTILLCNLKTISNIYGNQ